MATHSHILAWKIPWTEEPGKLQSVGPQKESDVTLLSTHHHAIIAAVCDTKKCIFILGDNFKNKEYSSKERVSTQLFSIQWSFISVCIVTC